MSDEKIIFHIDNQNIARLTFNQAEIHNAFDDTIIVTLNQHFQKLATEKQVRCLLIQAKGKSFCAGADLNWMKRMADYSKEENIKDAIRLATMLQSLKTLPFPTIALVQGAAFGGGAGLLCCCDIVLASEQAKFCFSEVKLGLTPSTIAPYVIAAMGERQAKRYLLTGEIIDSQQAQKIGLIHEITTQDNLLTTGEELCQKILLNSPQAVSETKKIIDRVLNYRRDVQLLQDTAEQIATMRVSEQGQEGLRAFFAKRQPNWTHKEPT